MTALSDDDLELWLSRYIDNELEPTEKDGGRYKSSRSGAWNPLLSEARTMTVRVGFQLTPNLGFVVLPLMTLSMLLMG